MESLRLSARLAGYVDAIKEARAAGVTWGQLADLFGARDKTMAAAFRVAASGKYAAKEQRPLPEPAPPASTRQTQTRDNLAPVAGRPAESSRGRSLPPGASQSASDVEALRAKGVKVHS